MHLNDQTATNGDEIVNLFHIFFNSVDDERSFDQSVNVPLACLSKTVQYRF